MSFTFANVTGSTGIITSAPIVYNITTCTISGTAHQNVSNTMTVVFSISQISTPSLGPNLNGTVSSISGSGTTFTFTWTPVSLAATIFYFFNVTGYNGTIASSNSITPLA